MNILFYIFIRITKKYIYIISIVMLTERIKIVLFCLLLIILILILYDNSSPVEPMINIKYSPTQWNRNNICTSSIGNTLEKQFKKYNIGKDNINGKLHLPCDYNNPRNEINNLPVVKDGKYFILNNPDILVAKDWLWRMIVRHYGYERPKFMLPNSYVLYLPNDMNRFNDEYNSQKIYIMKKNIQRQEGLKITKDKNEIINGHDAGYVIVQELLQNPYIINGRKTNMRFYVLVICQDNQMATYVYNDGFMYYTKVPFVPNTTDIDPNITTGYIDRQVYKENPLTHDDLRKYLDSNTREISQFEIDIRKQGFRISQVYFQRIYDLLKDVFMAFIGHVCSEGKLYNNITFQIFGVDIAVDDHLNPMVMEVNKGPDMGGKDERDLELKSNVIRDVLRLIGAVDDKMIVGKNKENGFLRILEIDNGLLI